MNKTAIIFFSAVAGTLPLAAQNAELVPLTERVNVQADTAVK